MQSATSEDHFVDYFEGPLPSKHARVSRGVLAPSAMTDEQAIDVVLNYHDTPPNKYRYSQRRRRGAQRRIPRAGRPR